ncbi:MAG: nucleoside monophosphate kinase [Patescibacteria group bacterium]|nr:nucleoside monophosphate kinase [Patescibacteria group bacterium]
MNIVIIGPPGSGKSTQADLLAKELGVPHISTGIIFREIADRDSGLARSVENYLEKGEFVPDEVVMKVLEEELPREKYRQGFVLEGYPRNIWQAKNAPFQPDKVFYLDVSDEESMHRLLKRGREDDTEEIIEKRLADYHQQTEPVLSFYSEKGVLEPVDGEQKIEEIFEDLKGYFSNDKD